ncbi:MAG: hypothetical protein JNN15_11320 [Blastocatellia bacterium]|nr:hypothetical protein [Blastocatellia bacterium]
MKKQALKIFTFATALTIALMFSFTNNAMQDSNLDNPVTGLSTLERAYQEWQAKNVNNTHILNVQLGWIKGLSSEPSDAVGTARLNQTNGTISLRIKDIKDGDWQLWFIENHPEGSTIPEATDKIVEVARFTSKDGIVDFEGKIDLALIDKMEIDRIAITRTGINPAEAFVLSGSPTLFERLQRRELLARRTESSIASRLVSWFTPTASADKKDDLTRLIEDGKKLFNEEKFKGNGRTCATCHPASNNFTIDPAFIATLPPNDPLFVAEFDPNLANNFENPALMRQFGLILENVDGFEDLQNKFVMRSVNHTLGMSQSLNAPDPVFGIDFTTNGVNPNPTQRTGWGGDGSPGSGSLREFAIGAVIQHFPKTLSRTPGSDFRLPTDRELDAMEAFQLSLGRQEEVNIRTLSVRDGLANNGKTLFLDTGNIGQRGRKNCNACHFNAGATTGFALNTQAPGFTPLLDGVALGFNGNQGTNTIALPQVAALGLPVDGGFGKTPLPNGGFGTFAVIG